MASAHAAMSKSHVHFSLLAPMFWPPTCRDFDMLEEKQIPYAHRKVRIETEIVVAERPRGADDEKGR